MTERPQDDVLMVIPSIDGATLLARMLPTLRFNPAGIVVLDQGSADDTQQLCAAAGVELVQLGRPHTYTEACNIGARMAKDRGCAFFCISYNDIAFRTDVIAELRAEMLRAPTLGIVAPSQVIVDEATGERRFTSRVYWNLDRVEFLHDTEAVDRSVARLEADFCELTCALVRMSAIAEIGFLDDEYGFYHEDADFGFRLRQAGYTAAYLPQSQIDHYSSSTFGREMPARKKAFLDKNRRYFTSKHLGLGIHPNLPDSARGGTWDGFGSDLSATLLRFGLIEVTAPELVMARPGVDTRGYDYTDATAPLPTRWTRLADSYRAVFTATSRMRGQFEQAGFPQSFHVPPGVETDLFHPWGPVRRLFDGPTILVLANGWDTDWLAQVLDAWRTVVSQGGAGWLVIAGNGLSGLLGAPDWSYNAGTAELSRHEARRIELHDQQAPQTSADLAQFYRAMDFVLPNPADAALHLPLLRAMACGVACIVGPGAVLAELLPPNALTFTPDTLQATLARATAMDPAERTALATASVDQVRGRATLRHTAFALYAALAQLQIRDPAEALERIRERETAELLAAAPPAAPAGGGAARRMKAAGRLVLTVGAAWEEKGLRAAGQTMKTELGYFLGKRAKAAPKTAPVAATQFTPSGTPPLAGSTLLVGYIDAQLGLGQSMRGLARAMAEAECPFAILPVGLGVEGRRGDPYMPERYDTVHTHAVNVLEVAANELLNVRAHVGEYHFTRSYNILRTYWELGHAPEAWRPNLAGIQEMWAPTNFVAESFRGIFDGPITVIPPCIDRPQAPTDGQAQFGLAPDRFHFLFSFDYYSFPQRKNPLGVIRAFRRAFPDPRTKVGLVVKSTGAAGHFPDVKQALREAAGRDGRITIIDESLSRAEMLALMAAADCYVSLHRAEGFGLGMAEAMALGKPVIGTDYSGSTDFLSPETGFPVACTLRPVRPDEYVHTENQVWADPDETSCATAMRTAVDDRPGTSALAAAGQRFIQDRFGPAAVGALVAARLQAISTKS